MEISGELEGAYFNSFRPKAVEVLGRNAVIDGFRPGHVPEQVLAAKLGEEKILFEMAELALAEIYPAIIEEKKIDALGKPDITITKLAMNNPLGFKITTAVMPVFELPDYRALAAEIRPAVSGQVPDSSDVKEKEKRRLEIIESIAENTKIILPAVIIENELERMLEENRALAENMSIKWEEYLKQINKKEEEIKDELRDKAKKRAAMELIIWKIAEKEKIEPAKEEVEKEVAHFLSHYKDADPARLRVFVKDTLTKEKVFEILESSNENL